MHQCTAFQRTGTGWRIWLKKIWNLKRGNSKSGTQGGIVLALTGWHQTTGKQLCQGGSGHPGEQAENESAMCPHGCENPWPSGQHQAECQQNVRQGKKSSRLSSGPSGSLWIWDVIYLGNKWQESTVEHFQSLGLYSEFFHTRNPKLYL